jgi:quercetin dioxygenase-like cupin family protein
MGRRLVVAALSALLICTAVTAVAFATPALGFIAATVFARGTLASRVTAHSDHVVLMADRSTDHVVQRITWGADSSSGWHTHPGITLVTVRSGAVAVYDAKCVRRIYSPGQTFWESGDRPALVRNEASEDAEVYVTYVVEAGAALRADSANPGCDEE